MNNARGGPPRGGGGGKSWVTLGEGPTEAQTLWDPG